MLEERKVLVIYISTLAVVGLLTFLINLAVLLVIIKYQHLHLPSNMYMASMALANAVRALVGLPLWVISSFNEKFNFTTCMCINSVYTMLSNLPVLMLMGFTIDRLLALRWPYTYYTNVECKQAIIATVVLWSCGLLSACIPTLIIDQTEIDNYTGICNYAAVITMNYIRYYRFIFTFLVPIFVMIIINVYILYIVRRHRKSITTSRRSIPRRVVKRHWRAEKILLLLVFTFTICGLPLNIVEAAWSQTNSTTRSDPHMYRIVSLLYHLQALLDPMIYGYNDRRINKAIKAMFFCSRTIEKSASVRSRTASRRTSPRQSKQKGQPVGTQADRTVTHKDADNETNQQLITYPHLQLPLSVNPQHPSLQDAIMEIINPQTLDIKEVHSSSIMSDVPLIQSSL